jgi:hypothetical protein
VKRARPLRTAVATLSSIAALIVLAFALQDVRLEYHALAEGSWVWAVSRQGIWQLANGIVELAAAVFLAMLTARTLGVKFSRRVPVPSDPTIS